MRSLSDAAHQVRHTGGVEAIAVSSLCWAGWIFCDVHILGDLRATLAGGRNFFSSERSILLEAETRGQERCVLCAAILSSQSLTR